MLFGRTTHRPDLEPVGLVPLSPSSAKQPLYSDYERRALLCFIHYVCCEGKHKAEVRSGIRGLNQHMQQRVMFC